MDKKEYERYVVSLLTPLHKIQLYTSKNKNRMLYCIVRFYQSAVFSEEDSYYDVLRQDYENCIMPGGMEYLSGFIKFNKEHPSEVAEWRRTGEYFRTDYYLKALKFENFLCISKHVKEEFKYYIKASNAGIYGRIPMLKSMEKVAVNEVFRLLRDYYNDYCGLRSINYYFPPYYYISFEEMIDVYKMLLEKCQ